MTSAHTVITTDRARLQAFVHEPTNADPTAPTIVLAHGWTLGHEFWWRVVEGLGDTHRIVSWDQRGHGGSTLANGLLRSKGESIKRLGEDLREVVSALVPKQSPLVLGGHSMGGMTIMAWAGQASQEELDRLRGVVFASTAAADLTGLGIPGEAGLMRRLAKFPAKKGHLGKLVREAQQRQLTFGENPRREDVQLAQRLGGETRLITYGAFYLALMEHDEKVGLKRLANIPVTTIIGTRDKLTPQKLSTAIHEILPESELVVLEGKGHMTPVEAPEVVVDALRAKL